MDHISAPIEAALADESGVTAIEYALLGALISIFIIAGAGLMSNEIAALYVSVADKVRAALTG